MTKLIRALILPLALILAAPAFANKDSAPGQNKKNNDTNVDCGKIEGDDARKKCREMKHNQKTDDSKVDCSKIDGDDARKKCREVKHNK
jgi:hypothetical protein